MLGNAFLLAFRQILRNPMRSLLTVLGIVITAPLGAFLMDASAPKLLRKAEE